MKRALLATIPVIAAAVVGVSGLVTSPIACGCEDGPMQLAAAAGLDHYKAHSYTAEQFQAGLNAHFVGQSRSPHELFSPGLSWCEHPAPTIAECFIAFSESWLIQTGMLVTLETTQDGSIQRAQVQSHWRSPP